MSERPVFSIPCLSLSFIAAFLVVFLGDLSAREAHYQLQDSKCTPAKQPAKQIMTNSQTAIQGLTAEQITSMSSAKQLQRVVAHAKVEAYAKYLTGRGSLRILQLSNNLSNDQTSIPGGNATNAALGGVAGMDAASRAMTTALVGSGQMVVFPADVPKNAVNNIMNCLLFSQTVANTKFPNGNNGANVTNWYDAFVADLRPIVCVDFTLFRYYEYVKVLEEVCQFTMSASAAVAFSAEGRTVSISKTFLEIVAQLASGAVDGTAWAGALTTAYKALKSSSGNLKLFNSELSKFSFNTIQQILVKWNNNTQQPYITMASLAVDAKSLSEDVLFVEYSTDQISVNQRTFVGTQNTEIFDTCQGLNCKTVAQKVQEKLQKNAMLNLEQFLDDDASGSGSDDLL